MRAPILSLCLCLLIGSTASARQTLYERLGGEPGIHAISESLIDRVAADPVHGASFKETNLKRVKRVLAEQLCELSQGPCRYSGSPMKESHAGLGVTQADLYFMVQTLRDILHERHVPAGAGNELLRLLAPLKRDVVDTLPPKPPAAPAGAMEAAQP